MARLIEPTLPEFIDEREFERLGRGWAATLKDRYEPEYDEIECQAFGSPRRIYIRGMLLGYRLKLLWRAS